MSELPSVPTRSAPVCPLGHGPLEFIQAFDGEDAYECGKPGCSVCAWIPCESISPPPHTP